MQLRADETNARLNAILPLNVPSRSDQIILEREQQLPDRMHHDVRTISAPCTKIKQPVGTECIYDV